MFNFIFGLIWTAIMTPIIILCLVSSGDGIGTPIFLPIFFILFEAIGLYMLISGLKKIIKNAKTKKYGVPCYGIIRDIQATGAYVNERPEYKAILDFINPETNVVENIEEIVGFDYNKYPINSYVMCKYYQGDINFQDVISDIAVPVSIKEKLVPIQKAPNFSNLEISGDGEYVTIDGIQYKKNS